MAAEVRPGNKDEGPSTPKAKKSPGGPKSPTPKRASNGNSAPPKAQRTTPVAADVNSPAARNVSSGKKKAGVPDRTLLGDFLIGKPSPTRQAAARRRSVDAAAMAAAVRADAKKEVRQETVQRLQRPGPVKNRVKEWQRANAAVLSSSDPEIVPSEPTEIAVQVDKESVTEEDRMRIKMRQKPSRKRATTSPKIVDERAQGADHENEDDKTKQPGAKATKTPPAVKMFNTARVNTPPKKRIVSDENWMKRRQGGKSGAIPQTATQIPRDFLQKTAQNPSAKNKVSAWVQTTSESLSSESLTGKDIGSSSRKAHARHRSENDDGIRVRPSKSYQDDGIRVTPISSEVDQEKGHEAEKKTLRSVPARAARSSASAPDDRSELASSLPERRMPRRNGHKSVDSMTETGASDQADNTTITRASTEKVVPRTAPTGRRTEAHPESEFTTSIDMTSETGSTTSDGSLRATTVAGKSLADIPFGLSAFSELDLPRGAPATKRPTAVRQASLRAVPKVFKKVVREAKEIIQDKGHPPLKVVVNQPPNIENWLNCTIDPFTDDPTPRNDIEEDCSEARPAERITYVSQRRDDSRRPQATTEAEKGRFASDDEQTTPTKAPATAPTGAGLRRSRATRSNSSPLKPVVKKRALRDTINDLFRGESAAHVIQQKTYSSYEASRDRYSGSDEFKPTPRKSSSDLRARSPSPELSEVSTEFTDGTASVVPKMATLPRRRIPPPTSGEHELSTIFSAVSDSTSASEGASTTSHTTVTQATALTRSTDVSRRSSKNGLKRRLTKHSDLISVLSLPDSVDAPILAKGLRATASLRRRTSKLENVTLEDLLIEFVEDGETFKRELKTLVDGAIPVLLTQFVHGGHTASDDLFGSAALGASADATSKAVVNMGVALEKLNNLHKRIPSRDVQRIIPWLEAAHPALNSYLDAWRLGFEGIVVNLAPAPGKSEEQDSLVNALPRDQHGDVVDASGQRVDLQRLLSRPLARIRGLFKLLKGAKAIGAHHDDLEAVLTSYTALYEKSRRRHREETARITDEDASNTTTIRCSDLRTLLPKADVLIDPSRQVNAKDHFALDLTHSSRQRLECQVELIYRDKPRDSYDRGDVLIRESGRSQPSLLFPPIPSAAISARRSASGDALRVCVRGRHNGQDWSEMFTLTTDVEAQVDEWLEIIGHSGKFTNTASDRAEKHTGRSRSRTETSRDTDGRDALSHSHRDPRSSEKPENRQTEAPSRYHRRQASAPVASFPPEEHISRTAKEPQSPAKLKKSPRKEGYREDGAPPPPPHRITPTPKLAPVQTNVELTPSKIRRRTSSPLKHEFRPSDVDSSTSISDGDSGSQSESSDEDLDGADGPGMQPAVCIKTSDLSSSGSVISAASLNPSNSASQRGLHGEKDPRTVPADTVRLLATVSYWSNSKGQWKDAWPELCAIVITPGLVEAHVASAAFGQTNLNSSGSSEVAGEADAGRVKPLIALELTPVVLIRQSTVVDLEIRSPVRPYSKLATIDGKIFRFRASSVAEGAALYEAVHQSRMNNAKYKALAEEARFRAFGQQHHRAHHDGEDEQSGSTQRRSWFGRKNSYRASTRAPTSQNTSSASPSQNTSSSGISAPSLLKRLTGTGNLAFNIGESSINRHSRGGSSGRGGASLYTSGSSSNGGGTPPRSPSLSLAESGGNMRPKNLDNQRLSIRCHLLVSNNRWEDHGNCYLQITRPPPGMRQELRIRHGMEKRIIVTKAGKKQSQNQVPSPIDSTGFNQSAGDPNSKVILDVVLGSKCFGRLGTRGIILNVWEELRDEKNNVGVVPANGGLSGSVKKWCFQCASAMEASWIYGLVAQEVMIG